MTFPHLDLPDGDTATGDDEAVVMTRTFKASRETLFRAWTEPALLMKWWGPPGFSTPEAKVDLRVGGGYSFTMQPPDGEPFQHGGTYREIEPPERLVFTWLPQGAHCDAGSEPLGESLVTLEFRDLGGETELTLRHERLLNQAARDSHREGWTGTFRCLADFVADTA